MPPKKPKTPLWLKIILIITTILGLGIIAVIIFIVALFSSIERSNQAAKAKLQTELAQLPLAPGCHESSRNYVDAGIDTTSTWDADYSCSAIAGPTHDALTAALKNRGYLISNDYSTGDGPGYLYSFTASNNQFNIEISFSYPPKPGDAQTDAASHASTNLSALKTEPISGYNLTLTESLILP